MKTAATIRDATRWIVQQAIATPRRAALLKSLGLLACVFFALVLLSTLQLAEPLDDVIAISAVLVCCWFGGIRLALIIPAFIIVMSRLLSSESKPPKPISEELSGLFVMTVLTGLTGLSGQYRRRFREMSRKQNARLLRQQRALGLAQIIFRNLEGRITTWTDGAEHLFGWNSDEATGQLIQDLLHTQFPRPLEEIRQELCKHRQWQGEVKQRRKDGTELIIATHWILYDGAEDEDAGVAEVHNDVTPLRVAEARVRESEERKDLFIATLAHELRNPLAPLRSGLECLRQQRGLSLAEEPLLGIMGRQLEHMVRLIDDLLNVSRINTGKVNLQREQILLSQIITDAIVACRPQIDAAGQELNVSLPGDPVYLYADSGRLAQVFTNLLHNAAKFTDVGGGISISACCEPQHVEIRIKDSGIGISTQMLPRVFDMFAQVQDVRVRGQAGLGLGLHIVKSLVEMHGGSVDVHSDGPGQGAEFTVLLPRLTTQPSPVESLGAVVSESPTESPRVLVVDDNKDAAYTLALALSNCGCTCRSVFDGASGLKEAREFDPQVFVLDLGMPGMSGLELAKHLRAESQFQTALLIAVTGWDQESDVRESESAGFDYHLAKPVDIGMLREAIHRGNQIHMNEPSRSGRWQQSQE